jgi:membrane fusion protein (multidrug efflux system)
MMFQGIEIRLPQPGKSLPRPRKSMRQAARNLLLASATILAAGSISGVLIGDSRPVKASQVTRAIDGLDIGVALEQWAALDQARAEFQTAEAAIHNIDAQIVLQKSVIAQQKADIAVTQASRDFVQNNALMRTGYATAQPTWHQTSGQLQQAQAELVATENEIEVLATERLKAQAERDRSRAKLHQVALNLSYTSSEIDQLDADVMHDSLPVKER